MRDVARGRARIGIPLMRNIVYGTLVASALALILADASIAGIQAWKIVLAGIGLALFMLGGRARTSRPPSRR